MTSSPMLPFGLHYLRSTPGYWYLGTPYSKYPGGQEMAFREAARATGWLIRHGVGVFSPICHTHPIAVHAGIDPLDHEVWLPADKPMMDAACGMIVCQMPTWDESYGLQQEIIAFEHADKPVMAMSWPMDAAEADDGKGTSQEESGSTADRIRQRCQEVADLLCDKNAAYGDSALHPVGIFSPGRASDLIRVRIDDKLSRIANRPDAFGEDPVMDLLGYLVLLSLAMEDEKQDWGDW